MRGESAHPPAVTRMNLGADSVRGTWRDRLDRSLQTDPPTVRTTRVTTTASPSQSDHDALGRGGKSLRRDDEHAPLLRPRGRRRAEAAVLPQTCRASFVQPEALVDASVAAAEAAVVTVPGMNGRRAARDAFSARVQGHGVLAFALRLARLHGSASRAAASRA